MTKSAANQSKSAGNSRFQVLADVNAVVGIQLAVCSRWSARREAWRPGTSVPGLGPRTGPLPNALCGARQKRYARVWRRQKHDATGVRGCANAAAPRKPGPRGASADPLALCPPGGSMRAQGRSRLPRGPRVWVVPVPTKGSRTAVRMARRRGDDEMRPCRWSAGGGRGVEGALACSSAVHGGPVRNSLDWDFVPGRCPTRSAARV